MGIHACMGHLWEGFKSETGRAYLGWGILNYYQDF